MNVYAKPPLKLHIWQEIVNFPLYKLDGLLRVFE